MTADLDQPDVDLRLDITAIDLPDAMFDGVICSHVLEHVADDTAAMRELQRITAPGGWCLVMVPLDLTRERTYEEPAITDPAGRARAFLQHDHVRLYAPDIGERLVAAGFNVERIRPREEFGDSTVERCGLLDVDEIWLCRPDLERSPRRSDGAVTDTGRVSRGECRSRPWHDGARSPRSAVTGPAVPPPRAAHRTV